MKRYALAWCVMTYMAGIVVLHLCGFFPRAGLYDLSRLAGTSQVTLEGRILDLPVIRWKQTRFLFEGTALPLSAFKGRTVVTLAFPDETLAPGDILRVRGWLSVPRPASLTRDFDERGYWATRRVFSMLKVWSPEGMAVIRSSPEWSLERMAWRFHRRYREFWERRLPWDETSLLLGVTIGARGILPRRVKEACIRAGVYHIVVVSGQNMSLVVSLGVSLLLILSVPRRHALWICFLPVVFYTATVGGDPPVVRAAVTSVVGLMATALGRDVPRYYPILLASGWILVQEPEAMLGASFQLSFGATLSILAILPLWEDARRRRSRWSRWFGEAVLMGLCVHLGIWPLLVHYFHRLSLASLVANVTVFPLSALLMILGLIVGTWGVIAPGSVPGWAVRIVRMSVHFMLVLIERMSAWSWAMRSVVPPAGWIVMLYYTGLFGILLVIRRRRIYAEKHPPLSRRSRLQRG